MKTSKRPPQAPHKPVWQTGELAARTWNIETFHAAMKKCKGDRIVIRRIQSLVRAYVTDFIEYVQQETNGLGVDARNAIRKDTETYGQQLLSWLRDGQDKDDLDGIERERLDLQRDSIIKRLKQVENWAGDNKELPWRDDDDFITNTQAVELSSGKLNYQKLNRLLKPDGPIRYMRSNGQRCKVHSGDFVKYLNAGKTDMFSEKVFEEIEKRKREIRQGKK